MLLDMPKLEASIDRRFPPHGGDPLTLRIERALGSYVRGQVLLSTIIGASAGVGMWLLGCSTWSRAQTSTRSCSASGRPWSR